MFSEIDSPSFKKTCCIVFDCHGDQMGMHLKKSKMNDQFKFVRVSINKYVIKDTAYFNNTEYSPTDMQLIKNADILILKVIENDRGFLNNDKTVALAKHNCKIIKIPHYRFSGYNYKIIEGHISKYNLVNKWKLRKQIKDVEDIETSIKLIKNQIDEMNNNDYSFEEKNNHLTRCIKEYEYIDNLSDIKMYNILISEWKNIRMFKGRSYPTSYFFYRLSQMILNELNIDNKFDFSDTYFSENTDFPVADYWYDFCNFSFSKVYIAKQQVEMKDYEWYYSVLLTSDANITDANLNKQIVDKIRKIIK